MSLGYAYWTHNRAYHRLNALHTMVFDTSYRPTILKDGATEYLYDGEHIPYCLIETVF